MPQRSRADFLALALLVIPSLAAARGDEFSARRLEAAGISSDADGIAAYLRSLLPDAGRAERAARLVEELGSDDFLAREAASGELATMSDPPIAALEAAARAGRPEVRARARRILRRIDRIAHISTLLSALQVIETRPVKGLAELLVELISLEQDELVTQAACRALLATVGPEDAALLRTRLGSSNPKLRAACLPALALALGEGPAPELVQALRDSEDRVRLAAAEGLAYLKDRACLPTLVDLLDSRRFEIRRDTSALLRAVTGREHGFAAHASAEDRVKALRAWREWLDESGPTADLRRPEISRRVETGRTLVCVWADHTLIEVDAAGHTVFEVRGFEYVWGCQGLPNGHRLAVDSDEKFVVEFDAAGRECWRRENLPGRPTSVQRLDNENTLLALSDEQAVVEIALSGEIVWRAPLTGRPTTAQRLANGNTLVNLQDAGEVVEIDSGGTVLWRLKDLHAPLTAHGLENGNVLVCEMRTGTVTEYNRQAKPVRWHDGFANPAQAQRLANGNTLVSDERGLHEINPLGERVWHLPVSRARFHRY
jgi:hypothetical protein